MDFFTIKDGEGRKEEGMPNVQTTTLHFFFWNILVMESVEWIGKRGEEYENIKKE